MCGARRARYGYTPTSQKIEVRIRLLGGGGCGSLALLRIVALQRGREQHLQRLKTCEDGRRHGGVVARQLLLELADLATQADDGLVDARRALGHARLREGEAVVEEAQELLATTGSRPCQTHGCRHAEPWSGEVG